ncbi:TrlF family AAA-like ATPase [Sediminibacterium soli]|uniref:TrlF family AAA-like ATPase n=1 Tax=Sediminibacterium soli TaxID=2698829 RepID=UPI001379FE16|nr:AAA family ATPase [Sediminibacterium soli]NCI48228.1 hypothetical protein [Sediminibacterium soli]
MSTPNNKGSQWRIWDLHVHSPATYGGSYQAFIDNAKASKADVIGINDYCSLKGYEEIQKLGGIPDKTVFPVVEFRMHNIVANRKNADPTKSGVKINFHIIFDNDPALFQKISTWLNSLECYDEKAATIHLATTSDVMKVSFDFEKVLESLKKHDLHGSHAVVWLPYDEYGGIDDIDPNDNFFKLALINKSDVMGSSTQNQIAFFKWEDEKFTAVQYESWFDKPKPCIKGSDAHKIDYAFGHLMDAQSMPTDRFCWINADLSFAGLRQIINEPDRVFIGDEPDLLKRINSNKTKFIKSLSIKKVEGAAVEDVWFDNFSVDFNGGLVAIIGNKGGGKSAITDVIGLCGNTHQDPSNFSFLQKDKFRKQKPSNLSEKFEATMTWADDTQISRRLSDNPDRTSVERVKYIPQNFLERLCTDVESDAFEKELKQIIYSHTPVAQRLGKMSLDELITYKSSLIAEEIQKIQNELSRLNIEIVLLERKDRPDYRSSIDSQLNLKKDELTAHIGIKPVEPAVAVQDEATKALIENLGVLRGKITNIEEEIKVLNGRKGTLSISQEELNRTLQYYTNLDGDLKKVSDTNGEFPKILVKNDIHPADVFSYKIDTSKIVAAIREVGTEIAGINDSINPAIDGSKAQQLAKLNEQLKTDQEVLDKPAKEQQKYLDAIKEWQAKKDGIEGSDTKEGSVKFLEAQLLYLTNTLSGVLTAKYQERRGLTGQLYSKKVSLVEVRKQLFQPVTQFISDFKELKKRYDVKIDVALELRAFEDNFLNSINQGRIGSFAGKDEGYKRLNDIIEKTHFETSDGFIAFTEELIDNLKADKRTPENASIDPESVLKKGVELNTLYDYIFNAEYLQPVYNLKLGDKTLQELSPGERGALLLIFYLILDNEDIPLVIDQPEENLDNESVYHILVHFIKKVKEKRQIILVTHNPNLAVVCDADQVINMQIEKENKNTVKCTSGSIENESINKAIINILEGTMPAFKNRDSKYIR